MMHQYKGVPRHDPASDPLRLCLAERLRCEYTTIDPPLSRGVPHHTLPHFLNNRFIRRPLGSSIAVYSKNPLALPHLWRGPHAIRIFLVFNADILGELLQYFGMGGYMGILYATIIEQEEEEEGIHNSKHWDLCFGIVGGISIQYTAVAFGYCRRKSKKTGYVYIFICFLFCVYFLYASVVQQNLFYAFANISFTSTNYSILYCTFHSVFLVQWMHHIKEKMLGEYGKYVYYLLCSFLYYIVPTTHHNSSTVSSSFHCCWRVGMMAYFLFTYYCKWGGHTYHFFMAHFFTLLLSGFEC